MATAKSFDYIRQTPYFCSLPKNQRVGKRKRQLWGDLPTDCDFDYRAAWSLQVTKQTLFEMSSLVAAAQTLFPNGDLRELNSEHLANFFYRALVDFAAEIADCGVDLLLLLVVELYARFDDLLHYRQNQLAVRKLVYDFRSLF